MMINNNFFDCLGVCQRLFNFLLNNLIPIGLKRVATTTHSMRQGPTAVPILSAAKPNRSMVDHHHHNAHAHAQFDIARGPTQMGSLRDEEEEEEERKRKRKGKSVVMTGCERLPVEVEEVKLPERPRPARQRQVRPLFDVAANINEKSDAFIRSRKEAMRRNYHLETTTNTPQMYFY